MRRVWLLAGVVSALALLVVAFFWLRPARIKQDTSFLVIVVDSMRADHLAPYGYTRATSPVIDGLARDGIVFENAWSQAPWTRPSVASIFTSTFIAVHRVLYSGRVVDGEKRTDVLSDKFVTIAEALHAGGYATGGFGKKIHLRPGFGFGQGFDGYDMNAGNAARINKVTLRWLRHNDPDRFFIYLHYNDPHYPYKPAARWAKFGATKARVQINGRTKKAFHDGALQLSPADIQQLIDLYDGEIAYTDDAIGALLHAIGRLGYRRLLVLVTADHGEEFLDHGDITHGQSLYNELIHVPFIIGGTGLESGSRHLRVKTPVRLIDIMPTFLQMAGLPEPPGIQGTSLVPLMSGEAAPPGTPLAFSQRRDEEDPGFSDAITDGRWKLIRDRALGRTMLFDLAADPGENLPVGGVNQDVVARLTGEMDRWSEANTALYDRIRPEETTPLDPETEERLRSLGYIN